MKWNLKNLYENLDAWQKDFEKMESLLKEARTYQGKLSDFEHFKAYYNAQKEAYITLHKLYQYANLNSDLNRKNVENSARVQKVGDLLNRFSQATAFEKPEVLSLGWEKVDTFLKQDQSLEEYRFPLEKLFHQSEHILDKDKEEMLS
ncbi:hypothetical protein, partial [Methanocalculus natronophilus]|uniref:hypothetical protein n=1 Tax=Methanocalculus natronophilus TaxID=1262400 RepID=UPI0031B628D1